MPAEAFQVVFASVILTQRQKPSDWGPFLSPVPKVRSSSVERDSRRSEPILSPVNRSPSVFRPHWYYRLKLSRGEKPEAFCSAANGTKAAIRESAKYLDAKRWKSEQSFRRDF